LSASQFLRSRLTKWRAHILGPGVFVLTLLAGLAVYWIQLDATHKRMRAQVTADTQRMASQSAIALAQHVDSVVRKIDYFSQHLGWTWLHGNFTAFDDAATTAMRTLPPGALLQVAVADVEGRIRYSRLADDPKMLPARPRVSIADREHFYVHKEADSPFLFVSSPLKSRASDQWAIQFSRPIVENGEFRGVMVLSISAEYLATAFKAIFPDSTDAASLFKNNGLYLTRSHYLDEVVGKTLPDSHPFVRNEEEDQGSYEAVAGVDGIRRIYSWQRVGDFPLVVAVGLGTDKALSTTENAISHSRLQSGLGSTLLLLATLTMTGLWVQGSLRSAALRRVADQLRTSRAQLRLTLDAVRDGLWNFNHHTKVMEWDERIRSMLGYGSERSSATLDELVELTHPADQPRLLREATRMASLVPGPVMNLQVRLRGSDGRWLWVLARGRVIEWDIAGKPLQSVGTLTDITEHVAEANLRDALLNRSAAAILLVSPDRRMVNANARFASLFLKPGQELQDLDFRDIHIDIAHWEGFDSVYDIIRDTGRHNVEYPFRDANGNIRWFETHGVLQDPDDPQSNVIWTWIDITKRLESDAALAVETLRLNTLLESFPGGVLIEDAADTVVFVNPSWTQLLGMDIPGTQLVGKHDGELRALLGPKMSGWLRSPHAGRSAEARRSHEIMTDKGRHLEIDHIEIRQHEQYLGSVWLLRDITERKQHELELAQQASTDALTGLPNRRSFLQRLNELHDQAVTTRYRTGVLMMADIDHFKHINDTYGHSVGDIVLQHIADILLGAVRTNDMACRLGGEEFAILLTNASLADSLDIAERIRENVENAVIEAGEHTVNMTISLGLSEIGDEYAPDDVIEQADEALYQAKAEGRNRVAVWQGLQGEVDQEMETATLPNC
jgi:PAS domain S-box/diguanylate cyclase (GGDEF) domain